MKIKMTKDHDHRVSPAVVKAFKAETVVNVPKTVADEFIAKNVAAPEKTNDVKDS